MSNNLPAKSEYLIYRTDDGEVKLDVRLEDETIWLTQQMIWPTCSGRRSRISVSTS